ncbi:TPA: hypothetical protein R9Y97_005840 [Bacillus cereus]|nr:hypothetical protein [Bacillus cereus]
MILDGKHLMEQADIQDALKVLLEKPKFNEIVDSLQGIVKFSKEDFKVVLAYIFDTQSLENGKFATGQTTVVRAVDRIQIRHTILKDQEGKVIGEGYTIDTVNNEGGLTVYAHYNELEEIITKPEDGFKFLEDSVNEELIDNKEFKPLSTVKEEGWGIPFCMIGYNHCGPGCGDDKTFGGGPTTNAIDSCCRSHDRCWDNFGENDACCDRKLVDCARANRGAGSAACDLIVTWFTYNANKCK